MQLVTLLQSRKMATVNTYSNDGGTTNKTVATLDDEMHIKDTTYTL